MSTVVLKDLVTIQGSYIAAVDIADTYEKASRSPEGKGMREMEEKVKSYLADDSSVEAILSIAKGLSPGSNERTHLISGAYGTGKSHLGLVLANYFALPSDHLSLDPPFSQIAQQDADKAAEIRSLRASERGFLVVIVSGVEADTFNQALLQGLRKALRREKLLDFIPTTAFDLARRRMDGWKGSKPDLYERFLRALDDVGQTPEGLVKGLENYDDEAYKAFCQAHQKACDAAFEPFREEIEAKRFYEDVSEKITKKTDKFQGIVVIWDEYGEYLKGTAGRGGERLQSQFFAQFCNSREPYQCHFIVIAHLALRDYFPSPIEYEDYIKQSGRFKESTLTTSNAEELIARAITQLYTDNPEAWEEVSKAGNWTELVQVVADLDLYPMNRPEESEWVRQRVVDGCFPLHPLAVYCLPRLSEEVAQRNRTTFGFLNDLAAFLDGPAYTDAGRLNTYAVDRLFDYFSEQIKQHKIHRRVFRAATAGQQQARNEQQVRILKAIGIFEILKDKKLKATADTLFSALYVPKVQRSTFDGDLEALVAAEVLRKTTYTGEYKFRGGEDYDYTADFEREREQTLRLLTNPIQTLNRECPAPDVQAGGLKPDDYNRQFSMDRRLKAQFIGVDALEGTSEFQLAKEIEQSPYHDGICLYVIASNEEEIRRAKTRAETIEDAQIAIGIPQSPRPVVDALIDLKTATSLRQQEPYGKYGTDAYEEAKEQQERRKEAFGTVWRNLLMPDNLTWHVGGKVEGVSGERGAEDLASRMMFAVFPDTPKIAQERIAYKWKGTRKSHIVEVLDALMDFHTPIKLKASGAGAPSSRDILTQASLQATGLLQYRRNAGMYDDYEIKAPSVDASAHKVWTKMNEIMTTEIPKDKLVKTVTALRKPPFGMSENAIMVLLGAYMRYNHRDLTFSTNGTVIPALTGQMVYEMTQNPGAYTITYRKLQPQEIRYLKIVFRLTTQTAEIPDQPTIYETARSLRGWYNQLPMVARSGQDVSAEARSVLEVLADLSEEDVLELGTKSKSEVGLGDSAVGDESPLFNLIAEAVGFGDSEVSQWDNTTLDAFEKVFGDVIAELQGYCEAFAKRILTKLRQILNASGNTDQDLADGVRDWFNGLSQECQMFSHVGDAQVLMAQAQSDALVRERFLVKLPVGFGLGRYSDWPDPNASLARYIQKVSETTRFLEEFRVGPPPPPPPPMDWKEVLRERLGAVFREFSFKLSREEIIEVVDECVRGIEQ